MAKKSREEANENAVSVTIWNAFYILSIDHITERSSLALFREEREARIAREWKLKREAR